MFRFVSLVFLLAFLISCSGAPSGIIFQHTIEHKDSPGVSTIGSRTGLACNVSYFGLISTGDAGIRAAAASGGITTVRAVDYSKYRILGIIFQRTCTIAHGD